VPRKPNPGETLWTPALVERLSELWLSGTASGEIGRRLGISRSSVMGKLRRLDLLCRDRPRMPIRSRWEAARNLLTSNEQVSKPPQKPKKPAKTPDRYFAEFTQKPLPPPPPEPPIGSYTILQLKAGQCRWPQGERPDYQFCGERQASQSSYCESHSAIAHSRGSQRDYDRAAEQALAGKLFASRAGIEQ
jgi:GcrA cell cycle regulator